MISANPGVITLSITATGASYGSNSFKTNINNLKDKAA
jgi:hypothetical protein